MPGYTSDKPYHGPEVLLVSMDIGTTQSAVSFAHCYPGERPSVQMVTRWPGRAVWSGAAKIPTIVSYRDGKVNACGEEALVDLEEDPKQVAAWFKLHLHPAAMGRTSGFEIPDLPIGITVERAYSDMMGYLMENTRRFFQKTIPDGENIWSRLRETAIIVLTTPNGWELRQQAVLRKAAVSAGLLTEKTLADFVTESEASLHFALLYGTERWLKPNTTFAIIDAGGSTVDTTVYECNITRPVELREVCAGGCVQAGGIYVNRKMEGILSAKLKGSQFDDPEIIRSMMEGFERQFKPEFDGSRDSSSFRFDGPADKNLRFGVSGNRISLSNTEVAMAYHEVERKIIESCTEIFKGRNPKYLLLFGGFAESPHLQRALRDVFEPQEMKVIIAGENLSKAAAEGASIWYLKGLVESRTAKVAYGGCIRQKYDETLHSDREHAVFIDSDGNKRVRDAFHIWVNRGALLRTGFGHKAFYQYAIDGASLIAQDITAKLSVVGIDVYAWEGSGVQVWCKDERGVVLPGMRHLCTLKADLSALSSPQTSAGPGGKQHAKTQIVACVFFHEAHLYGKLQWYEGLSLREGPPEILTNFSEDQ